MSIFTGTESAEVDQQPIALLEPTAAVPAPHVNLLPPEIAEQRAVRRVAGLLAGVVLLCVAGVGVGYVAAGSGEDDARAELVSAQAVQTSLQRQQRALLPAQQAQNQIQAARAALTAAMGNEVLWSRYLDQLRIKRPEGTRFTQVQLTPPAEESSGSSSGTTDTSTTAPPPNQPVAALTLTGKARTQPDVATVLDQLATIPGFSNVYLTSTVEDTTTGLLTYTVTADVTSEALSGRYSGDTE